jgi:YHS domain-containing protein
MTKNAVLLVGTLGVLLTLPLLLSQMGNTPSNASAAPGSGSPTTTHGHVPGSFHAPNVQSFADCHVEAILTPSGQLQLYIYGAKEKQLQPISAVGVEAELVRDGEDALQVPLNPQPYAGEPQGHASRFLGTFQAGEAGENTGLTVTIPYQNSTYRVQWRPEYLRSGIRDASETVMPKSLAERTPDSSMNAPTDEEKALFLTPGGKYTAADIIANGNQVAAIKYRGLRAAHDMHPKPGDRLCPITNTVASEKFAWIIGGKSYRFCCPPCIEEFVKTAKEKPETLRDPETYVQN